MDKLHFRKYLKKEYREALEYMLDCKTVQEWDIKRADLKKKLYSEAKTEKEYMKVFKIICFIDSCCGKVISRNNQIEKEDE